MNEKYMLQLINSWAYIAKKQTKDVCSSGTSSIFLIIFLIVSELIASPWIVSVDCFVLNLDKRLDTLHSIFVLG